MIQLRLDEILAEQGHTRYWLSQETGIKFQTLDGYFKNKVKRYDSYILNKICIALHCTPADIFVFTEDLPEHE